MQTKSRGRYYRVLTEGSVAKGDTIRLVERPNPEWTVVRVTAARFIPRKHEEFAAPRATAFGQLPGEYDASMSSDGPRIAVVLNSKGTYGVLTQTIQDSEEKVSETIDGTTFDVYTSGSATLLVEQEVTVVV